LKDEFTEKPPLVVNGRQYPMWSQFVHKKDEWIGGVLEDFGEYSATPKYRTEIVDIRLKPNGEKWAYFEVVGKDFTCGFDVQYGGVIGGEDGYITFSGFHNHIWRIKQKSA
jgi:hypothetical protein